MIDIMQYNKQSNKKIIYAVIGSMIIHICICIPLYQEIFLKKTKHTVMYANSSPVLNTNTNISVISDNLKQHNTQNQQSSDRFKISETQTRSHVPSTTLKKQEQNRQSSDRFKISETQTRSHVPSTTLKKQEQNRQSSETTIIKPKLQSQHHSQSKNIAITNSNELDDLLHNLINSTNFAGKDKKFILHMSSDKNNNTINTENDNVKFKNNEIDLYKNMIINSIQNKFYNASTYSGKTCDLRIQLDSNGKLISVIAISGDLSLCQAAVIATKLANIPKPPNTYIYKMFENTILTFSP